MSTKEKRDCIGKGKENMSIKEQCKVLGLNRSSYYYKAVGETDYNLSLMKLIDEEYTKHPGNGARKLTEWLNRQDHRVNHKRIERLMQIMGIQAIYPKPRLSRNGQEHRVFPYLLRNLKIDRPNQVWASDITYIRLSRGFVYLTAVMDWYSRYILSWELSISLDESFCIEAMNKALLIGKPEIMNTDQGPQYTGDNFINLLLNNEIKPSMDGKGRAFDNIFIERFWRTLKWNEVYLKDYASIQEARESIGEFIKYYNEGWLHQSLDYKTPEEVYYRLEKNRNQGALCRPGYHQYAAQ